MLEFFELNGANLIQSILEHILISLSSLTFGVVVGLPLGIISSLNGRLAKIVISIASLFQTVPSLALLAIMIPIFGIGKLPAILALFIYSLLPILRNTVIGIDEISPAIVDAAKGMGMTRGQILTKVKVPLAVPVIMSGIRLSAVYVVSWATLAAYIGGGGLGEFIFNGLNVYSPPMIVAGTIPVCILALLMDFIFGKLEQKVTPRTETARVEMEGK